MIVGKTARLCANVNGELTLGYYTNRPGRPNREARYQQHKGTRTALLAKARVLGITHLWDGYGTTASGAVPVPLHTVR